MITISKIFSLKKWERAGRGDWGIESPFEPGGLMTVDEIGHILHPRKGGEALTWPSIGADPRRVTGIAMLGQSFLQVDYDL